jgi:hypothetical protein
MYLDNLAQQTSSTQQFFSYLETTFMKWAGHIAHMWEGRGTYKVLVGRSEGRNHLEEPGVDGRIILKWVFKK